MNCRWNAATASQCFSRTATTGGWGNWPTDSKASSLPTMSIKVCHSSLSHSIFLTSVPVEIIITGLRVLIIFNSFWHFHSVKTFLVMHLKSFQHFLSQLSSFVKHLDSIVLLDINNQTMKTKILGCVLIYLIIHTPKKFKNDTFPYYNFLLMQFFKHCVVSLFCKFCWN